MKVLRVPVETDIKVLHKVSQKVDLGDVKLTRNLCDILTGMFDKLNGKAQGISAIQCGMPYCAVLLRYIRGEEPIVIFNPEVLFSFGSKVSNEGCLSEGDSRYIVKRPLLIKVRYFTRYREEVVKWLPYKKARIFMHEYDHLQGVLLQDKGTLVED